MTAPVILALETATEGCSVAVRAGGEVHQRLEEAPRQHSARLLPLAEAVLTEAGLARSAVDAVAFGRGPGAFIGVRMAASAAQGLCLAWSVPALPVSTLAALATGAQRRHGAERVLAALDARMGEVYCGAYRLGADGLMEPVGEEAVLEPGSVPGGGEAWLGTGRGFASYPEALPATGAGREPDALPEAQDLLPLAEALWAAGGAVPAEAAQPVYLRAWR